MSDSPPRMEVCPYCKKSFKRIKSHLPYCKMRAATIPVGQNVCHSKPPTLSDVTKRKGPLKDFIRAEGTNQQSESEERTAELIRNKPKGTTKSLLVAGLKKASHKKTDKNIKNQTELSPKMLTNTGPKTTLQGKTKAQSGMSQKSSPKRELAQELPKLGDNGSNPSITETSSLFGPVEPSSSNQDWKDSSGLPRDIRTPSANLKLDKSDLLRQELPIKSLDVPTDYDSSTMNLSDGVKIVGAALSDNERDPKARNRLSEVPTDVRNSETQETNTQSLLLSPRLGKIHIKESEEIVCGVRANSLSLGAEAHGSKGNTDRSLSVRQTRICPPRICSSKKNTISSDSGTEKKSQDKDLRLIPSSPRGTTHSGPLCVSQSSNQSLTSLAIRLLQEEKAEACSHNHIAGMQTLMGGLEQVSWEPRSACHHQALHAGHQWPLDPTWHHPFQTAFTSHVDNAERRTVPSSVGLEWFPELYPGYLGLGMLPGKPQNWSAVAQQPRLIGPKGQGLSEVPLLERRWTAERRIWDPLTRLTTSSLSLMRLLGALRTGCTRCSSSIKGSGLSGFTMLFTGYFVLCCGWSFRHLSEPCGIFSLNYKAHPITETFLGFSG